MVMIDNQEEKGVSKQQVGQGVPVKLLTKPRRFHPARDRIVTPRVDAYLSSCSTIRRYFESYSRSQAHGHSYFSCMEEEKQ